ncbi:MAG: hypothetical protein FVQ76_12480, partial [Nitrospira sp.]|nr:hypothetical protein [Nitrospira sp.]
LNSNELDNVNLDQEANTIFNPVAGTETTIFMIPETDGGRTASPPDGGTGFTFVITPVSELDVITDDDTSIDGRVQESFTGDDNAAVADVSTGPEVVVVGTNYTTNERSIIEFTANNITVHSLGLGQGGNNAEAVHGVGPQLSGPVTSASVVQNNTIWDNGGSGVRLWEHANPTITNNIVRGNGTFAATADGIYGDDTDNATVTGNTILDNGAYGIDINNIGGSSDNWTITNNTIRGNGANAAGQDAGIGVRGGDNTTISGNTITGNQDDGIVVLNGNTGNVISQNSIFNNGDLGIDLTNTATNTGDGVTSNDTGPPHDTDTGGNNLQNFPVLTSAGSNGATTTVSGYLNSTAGTTFTLEFFSSSTADPSGFGEGEVYLGSDTVTTNASGDGTFTTVLPVAVAIGDVVTATATTPGPNPETSEFSATENVTSILGLGGHWPLDEVAPATAADIAQGNDGTYQPVVTFNQPGACGSTGTSVIFDGATSFVEIPHVPGYLLDQGTVTFWARVTDATTGWQGLFSKDSNGFDTGGQLGIWTNPGVSGGFVHVRLQSNSASFNVDTPVDSVTNGVWFHVALSWGPGGMKLYLDGAAPITDPYTGGLGVTSGGPGNFEPIALGASTSISDDPMLVTPTSDHLAGSMDDVRIYDYELTLAEVQALTSCAGTSNITGTVYHDVDADADVVEGGTLTFAGATVRLFLDTGDGIINAADTLQATTTTNASGQYTFTGFPDGTYWVAVDSTTLNSGAAYNGGFDATWIWAEQTYGVTGAAQGAGFLGAPGALYGGRDANTSDIAVAANPVGSEHVTRVIIAGADATNIDAGFSFNAVVTTDDGDDVAG